MRRIDYIIIHHWGSPKATLQSIRKRHVEELGFLDVGYHYLIGNGGGVSDGEVVVGRPIEMGATQSRGFNSKSISILLAGDFNSYYPSRKQWSALVGLVKKLMQDFSVVSDNVLGHREIYPLLGKEVERNCPGVKLCCDKLRKEINPEGSEIFTDGARRRFDFEIFYDGIPIVEVEPIFKDNKILIDVQDLEKILDVTVESHHKMRRVEIKNIKSDVAKGD